MPSKTPAQAQLMRAVAHGWKPDRIKGPPVRVAKEFVKEDQKVKGYGFGGLAKLMEQARKQQDPDYDPFAEKYGTEPLSVRQAKKKSGAKGLFAGLTVATDLMKAGWRPEVEDADEHTTWYPSQPTFGEPGGPGGEEAGGDGGRSLREILTPDFANKYADVITPAAEGGYMDEGYQLGGLTGMAPPGRARGFPGGSRGARPPMRGRRWGGFHPTGQTRVPI